MEAGADRLHVWAGWHESLRPMLPSFLCSQGRLGGLLNLAVVPPHKEELKNILDHYLFQMELHNIKVKPNEPFTMETLRKINPDVLVVAVGAKPIVPDVPGIEGDHVVTSLDVLEGRVKAGENVAVIGGGRVFGGMQDSLKYAHSTRMYSRHKEEQDEPL